MFFFFFFFKQKTAYEIMPSLVGSEMCIRDSQRDERAGVGEGVDVGVQRDLLEEAVEARLVGALVVLGGDAGELLEVLETALGLERLLRLERRLVAALVEHAAHDLRDGAAGETRLQAVSYTHLRA